jgi:chitosanase
MLTQLQEQTIKAIVNVFETGSILGDYGQVTLLRGDRGGLTYGRSQTTVNSGGLHSLIDRYTQQPDATFAADMAAYLKPLKSKKKALEKDLYFANLLRAAADDPLMRETQDSFFDDHYYAPAVRIAERNGVDSALGRAVVYDSIVHGSWRMISRRTSRKRGKLSAIGEQRWITGYVEERRKWLAEHSIRILNRTVYRMDTFLRLIDGDMWSLEAPLVVRELEISSRTLGATPPGVYDGPAIRSRSIKVTSPLQRGLDVRRVQLALSKPEHGFTVNADGIYGRLSSGIVKSFQQKNGLARSGDVTPKVFATLGL